MMQGEGSILNKVVKEGSQQVSGLLGKTKDYRLSHVDTLNGYIRSRTKTGILKEHKIRKKYAIALKMLYY
jgi:hypothetical protein